MISNSTINILKRSIADTRRRILAPISNKLVEMDKKLSSSNDPKYLQGKNKKSEVDDGAKNE
tara:strand:+ start:11 stop:196 length:186 start_codon:yes stop_codon:yes gene_type:complete